MNTSSENSTDNHHEQSSDEQMWQDLFSSAGGQDALEYLLNLANHDIATGKMMRDEEGDEK